MGIDEADIARLRAQTRRERAALLLRRYWIPITFAFSGFAAGTVTMIAYNRMTSYPYATVVAATVAAQTNSKEIRRLMLISIPLTVVCILLGLKTGDVLVPQNRLPANAAYGVSHIDRCGEHSESGTTNT